MTYTHFNLIKILEIVGQNLGYTVKRDVKLTDNASLDLVWEPAPKEFPTEFHTRKYAFKLVLPIERSKDQALVETVIKASEAGYVLFQIISSDEQAKALTNLDLLFKGIDLRDLGEIDTRSVLKRALKGDKMVRHKIARARIIKILGCAGTTANRIIKEGLLKGWIERYELGHCTIYYQLKRG